MKKYLLSLITLIYLADGNAQTLKASIGAGSAANSAKIYVRPDITNAAVAISTLEFNVAIPAGITPIPTLTVTSNSITGATWLVEPPYTEGGYIHYNIYNNQSLYTLNCSAGVEFEAMEVTFTGGPTGTFPNTAHLVTLPDGGGGNGLALFYCTSAVGGVLNSNGQSLYYARDANVVFANGDTYRYVPGGVDRPQGTFTSFARLVTGIKLDLGALPVLFTKYDVKCNDKGAVLTWSTATEQNSNRFEIQRSTNGTDWVTIDNVAAAGNSDVVRNYQYVDLNGGAAFYRIRQVDNDGRFVYTAVKGTNCKVGQFDVTLYPVPTRDKLNVVIKSDKAVRTDLQVVDVSGRIVNRTTTQVNKGNNNFVLNLEHLPAGQYMLVSSDPAITINKKFTIIR